jgi:hypothetical protein
MSHFAMEDFLRIGFFRKGHEIGFVMLGSACGFQSLLRVEALLVDAVGSLLLAGRDVLQAQGARLGRRRRPVGRVAERLPGVCGDVLSVNFAPIRR